MRTRPWPLSQDIQPLLKPRASALRAGGSVRSPPFKLRELIGREHFAQIGAQVRGRDDELAIESGHAIGLRSERGLVERVHGDQVVERATFNFQLLDQRTQDRLVPANDILERFALVGREFQLPGEGAQHVSRARLIGRVNRGGFGGANGASEKKAGYERGSEETGMEDGAFHGGGMVGIPAISVA